MNTSRLLIYERYFHNSIHLSFLFLFIIAAGCGRDQELKSMKTDENAPDQIFVKPHIVITKKSLTNAIIEARLMRVYEKRNFTSLEDSIAVSFFNKEGVHTTTLTALNGEIWGLYENVDSLKANGDVVIVSHTENSTLETQSIRWMVSTHRIYADGYVKITTKDGLEEGIGFVAKDDLSEYEFTGPVSGEFRGKELKFPGE
jgi:LPS export ABC transporter protein LptC